MIDPSASPQPPEIPDYELVQCIGRGSYGDVWLARTATGVYRAVKVVWRERFPDPGPYEREFRGLREFEKVSLVQPRQLALLHVSRRDDEGFFYYVMELADDVVKGRDIEPSTYQPLTLRELRRDGAMGAARVVDLGVEMARGLAVLHDHGLVHRDIKPSNVVIVGGVPKLADIGLVAVSTMALTFVGTEGFVAPEGPGTPASDVYALGKVLYELATGLDRKLFPRLPDNFETREDRVLFLELNAVMVRACEPDRGVRHEHARSLLDDLLLVQAGKSVRRLRAAERGLARALRVAVVLALLTSVAGAGAWVAWSRAQSEMALRAEAEAERDALARKTRYVGLLAQASRAIDEREFGLARQTLQSARDAIGEAELGPEWYWLLNTSWGEAGTVLRENGPGVVRMALSPSGQQLAVVDRDLVLTVFDLATNQAVARLDDVGDLAGWSPDGTRLLATDGLARAFSWDGNSGTAAEMWPAPMDGEPLVELTPLAVLTDGEMLAVESQGAGRLVVWAGPEAPPRVHAFRFDSEVESGWQLFRHAVSPDQQWAAVAWVHGTGSSVRFVVSVSRVDGTDCVRFEPEVWPRGLGWERDEQGNPRLEVVNDMSGEQAWFDLERGQQITAQERLPVGSRAGEWVAEDLELRGVGSELQVRESGDVIVRSGHGGVVTQMLVKGETGEVISGAESGEIIRWNRIRPSTPRVLGNFPRESSGLDFEMSEDGTRVYAPGPNGVQVLNTKDGTVVDDWPMARWLGGEVQEGYVGILPNGQAATVLDRKTGHSLRVGDRQAIEVSNVAASPDGRTLIYARTDGSVWRLQQVGDDVQLELKPARRWAFDVDETGESFCYTTQSFRLVSWSLTAREVKWSIKMPTLVADVARIRKLNLLVAAVTNGELYVVEGDTGVVVRTIVSGSASAVNVSVNERVQRVFVGGNDGRIHVYDANDWLHLTTFRLPERAPIWSVKTSIDGSRLVILTRNGTLYVVAEKGD